MTSGNMELVTHIISANVMVLIENDQILPVLKKIDLIPKKDMAKFPWLGIARSWGLGCAEVLKSQQILDTAEKSAAETMKGLELQRINGHIAAARAYVYSLQGDKNNTITQARQADSLLPADEIATRALNLTIWGDVLSVDGHDPAAMPILEQALALTHLAEKPHVAMIATSALASAHLGAGRMHALHRVCLEALAVAEEYQNLHQRPLSATANVYSLLARVHTEWGENEKAIQYARKGVMLSEYWGQVDNDVVCLDYLGRALSLDNNWEQAKLIFRQADIAARKISPWLWKSNLIFVLESLLDSGTVDREEISAQLREIKESGVEIPPILRARLQLWDEKPQPALDMLQKAEEKLDGRPSFDLMRIFALRAAGISCNQG